MIRIGRAFLTVIQVRPGPSRRWLFLEIEDDGGRTGLAEATLGAAIEEVEAALTDAVPLLRARPVALDEVDARLGLDADALVRGRVAATVVSAIETALADLDAQARGVSLADALGGRLRGGVPLYANINRSLTEERTPAVFARMAAAAVAEGFTTVKCAPFDEVTPDPETERVLAAAAPGLERLRRVRAAVGPDIRLLVDCHSRFTAAAALSLAPVLRALDIGWFEEPLDPLADPCGFAAVAAEAGLTMAGAEMGYGVAAFARAANDARLDVAMPDIKHCGGVREAARIAAAMRARGVGVSPHSPSGPVCQLGSAQLCATLPGALALEYAWGEAPWRVELLEPAERIERGELRLPAGPGLGARLNVPLAGRLGRRERVGVG